MVVGASEVVTMAGGLRRGTKLAAPALVDGRDPIVAVWDGRIADRTRLAAEKLERVLTTDPGTGVMRHADAGYEQAIEVAREHGLRLPMLEVGD